MLDIVLVEPEIPPNAGNVIRLAANTGARLHLVEPLGFTLEDRQLKRAGLDYHDLADVRIHRNWEDCRAALAGRRLFALTSKGGRHFAQVTYQDDDVFVFGAESRGLPAPLLAAFPEKNAVAVMVFEAWRQLGFPGGK